MAGRLKNKNAVVTGSSTGIGREIALALAAEGARVVVNGYDSGPDGPGTNLKPLNAVVEEIKAKGGDVVGDCGSVADYAYAERLIKTCVDNFGSIDILVNVAGIVETGSIVNVAQEMWRNVIDVHLNGTFNCCRHAAPFMAKQKSGRIINTGSHAFLGIFGGTGYAAGKGGIISLTRAMARDMSEYKVTCNAFCPRGRSQMARGPEFDQYINYLHTKGWLDQYQRDHALNTPEAKFVPPLVVFLSTDAAANITGQIFVVHGGHVGLFPEPKEVDLLDKDHIKDGPWTVAELAKLLPPKLSKYWINLFNP